MHERPHNIWYPRESKRQEITQAAIDDPESLHVFERRYRPLADLTEVLKAPNEVQVASLDDAYHNLMLASTMHIGMAGVTAKEQILDICGQFQRLPSKEKGNTTYIPEVGYMWHPQPPMVEEYLRILRGLLVESRDRVWNSDRMLAQVRMRLYHHYVYDLCHAIKLRGEELPGKINPRWLEFKAPVKLSEDEKKRVLDNEPGLGIYKSVYDIKDEVSAAEINGRGLMAAIFAASYVLEEKHPSISERDATRLLLYNADVIGAQSWHRSSHAPYMYDSPRLIEGRSRFSQLIKMVENGPLRIDEEERLGYIEPQKVWGRCPLTSHVKLAEHEARYINETNRFLEEQYDVMLPVSYDTGLTLSTQLAIFAITLGEGLMNGRSHDHVRTYRQMELMNTAVLPPPKSLTAEQINQIWW